MVLELLEPEPAVFPVPSPAKKREAPRLHKSQHCPFQKTDNVPSLIRAVGPHSFMRIRIQLFISMRIRIPFFSQCGSGSRSSFTKV